MPYPTTRIVVPTLLASIFLNGCARTEEEQASAPTAPIEEQQTVEPSQAAPALDDEERKKLIMSFSLDAAVRFELGPTIERLRSGVIPLEHQQVVFMILKNTNEVAIHQMRGQDQNRVYINDDGREAVYNADGQLVEDGFNDGSYNYANAKTEPLLHFVLDISPWIYLGQSEIDPTTNEERIYAYMGDLESGISRAHRQQPFEPLPIDHQWDQLGQLQAMALFMHIIEASEAEELFTLFTPEQQLSDDAIIRVLTKLNAGFETVYSAATQSEP